MDVRELIEDLLSTELGHSVTVVINDDEFDFKVAEHFYSKEVSLDVDVNGRILVEKDEFEEMEARIKELEAEVEDLKAE